jgi:protein SCO1/2
MKVLLVWLVVTAFGTAASAGVTPHDLAKVALSPPAHSSVPMQLMFRDVAGQPISLAQAIDGRPALLLFVDYTCRSICGPALVIASSALGETGLEPGTDYRLIVVGIDPKDSPGDARKSAEQIGNPGVFGATTLLASHNDSASQLADAVGYRFSYDEANDQFAHPAGVLVLTGAGRVSRVLSSLALNPQDLRIALVEAGNGATGSLGDRLTVLCYGFDPVHGVYTPIIGRALQVGAVATVVGLIAFVMLLRGRTRSMPGRAR